MTNQFRSLVLLPTVFLVVLFGALLVKQSFVAYLFLLLITGEHIYYWNNSIAEKRFTDFRVFFADEYLKLIYLLIVFALYLINSILWTYIGWWVIFGYALNYIIFRSFASVGVEQINDLPSVSSKPIKSDFDVWSQNKSRLQEILEGCNDIQLKKVILEKLEYSGFMRSKKASSLIENCAKSSEEELMLNIRMIADLM